MTTRLRGAFMLLGLVGAACGRETKGSGVAADGSPADVASLDADASVGSDVPVDVAVDQTEDVAIMPGVCGSPGQGDRQDCEAASWLKLEDPSLTTVSGDGTVARGENIVFKVVLANRGTQSFNRYPCVAFVTDHPLVKFQAGSAGCDCRFAIFAGMTTETMARATVDPSIAPGTVVRLAANVAPLHGDCTGLEQRTFSVTVR